MIVFPNGKINLGLNVLRKRDDGFHNIETAFYPIPITDILEICAIGGSDNGDQFSTSGIEISGDVSGNLCSKAYQLLKKDFPDLPPITMHLHKAIPSGAGLGGGSADGAFALQLINDEFELGLGKAQLMDYAAKLGSDCPFFIVNKPCFATGRGELLEEINLSLAGYTLVLVNPGIHMDTGVAFSQVTPTLPAKSIKEIISQPIETWKNELKNDFEPAAFTKYPELKNIRDQLYEHGALYASMTGTGSTIFGMFATAVSLEFPQSHWVATIKG